MSLFSQPMGRGTQENSEEHWLSVSDLMAGLMMVFLFIAVALMRQAYVDRDLAIAQKDRIERIATVYEETRTKIFERLNEEFELDLKKWDAEIDRVTLSLDFRSPDVLFPVGSSKMRPRFRRILSDFIPRYVAVLKEFSDDIIEVRIEGHTSSEWSPGASEMTAYFENMQLSQNRTRSVLQYAYRLPSIAPDTPWVKEVFSAVGYSSAKLVRDENGVENASASRRVSFRAITNSAERIASILAES